MKTRFTPPFSAFRPLFLLAGLLAVSGSLAAPHSPMSTGSPVPDVTFRVDPSGIRGDSAALQVRVVIPTGWHIQSNAPLDDFLIPTVVTAEREGVRFGTPVFPRPLLKEFPALGGEVALFEDTVEIRVPAWRKGAGKDPAAAVRLLAGTSVILRYQACDDSQCLPPRTIPARYVKGTVGKR